MLLNRNSFTLLCLFQFFAGVNAGVVFQVLDRPTAGFVAGTVFVLVGLYSIYRFYNVSGWLARTGLAAAVLHTIVALVLFSKRLLTPAGVPVEDVYGIEMDFYHQGATYIFYALLLVTFAAAIKYRKA